ncbi:MAG: CPBP family intramembrane glutamic endopeptidase [Candidatus Cloacimonadales bacterium]
MSKFIKVLEIIIIFFLLPVLMKYNLIPLPRIVMLLLVFIVVLIVCIRENYFQTAWNYFPTLAKEYWLKIGAVYLGSFLVFVAYLSFILHQTPFLILRDKPLLMLIIALFYPLISALPQEIIYRTFFFARYKSLFSKPLYLLLFNIVAFSWLHVIYNNIESIVLTLIAGLVFTLSYYRKRSLLLVTLEHSILGLIIFLTGMGQFFYK